MKVTLTFVREVENFPKSCNECPFCDDGKCDLGWNYRTDSVKKSCMEKRHKDCKLQAE